VQFSPKLFVHSLKVIPLTLGIVAPTDTPEPPLEVVVISRVDFLQVSLLMLFVRTALVPDLS